MGHLHGSPIDYGGYVGRKECWQRGRHENKQGGEGVVLPAVVGEGGSVLGFAAVSDCGGPVTLVTDLVKGKFLQ